MEGGVVRPLKVLGGRVDLLEITILQRGMPSG